MRASKAYDYVVVGAGSAGCVVASRLSEDPSTGVLLLEAGPRDRKLEIGVPAAWTKLFKSEVDWDLSTAPQKGLDDRRIYWPLGKTLGGTSSINAMMYVRGHASDFDGWADLGNEGWGFSDVLPYFKRAEDNARGASRFHGAAGPMAVSDQCDLSPLTLAFVEAAVECGLPRNDDLNGERQEGVGLVQVTQRRGRRCSTAAAYLRPARRRPNLTVLTGAHATRVLFERHRAASVAYRLNDREEVAEARREVVLSAGSVGSPKLLMQSGIGPAEDLRPLWIDVVVDRPEVGKNLRDHLVAGVLARITQPISLAAAETKANLLRYVLRRRGMLTSNLGEAAAFVRTTSEPAPDLELVFAPALYLDEGLTVPTEHGVTVGAALLRPRSVGYIQLVSSDPLAPPRIEPNYLRKPGDLEMLVEGTKLARRVLAARAFAPYRGSEILPGEDAQTDEEIAAAVRRYAHTLYHPVGTCRMGVDDGAVVDPALRVRGVQGLRVVDASVMPTLVSGHTNAAAIMIGEKGADLIRQG